MDELGPVTFEMTKYPGVRFILFDDYNNLKKELSRLKTDLDAAEKVLELCAMPLGAYKRDQGEYAIECLKELMATAALAQIRAGREKGKSK